MRLLAYGAPGDTADDYLRMAESTTLECMYARLCDIVWTNIFEITHCR